MKRIKWKIPTLVALGILFLMLIFQIPAVDQTVEVTSEQLHLVTTTTMLADLAAQIGGERIVVEGLMGPGIDPHLYQASAGDVTKMQQADLVLYQGLHLEGKMGEVFQSLSEQKRTVICIEDGLDQKKLYQWSGGGGIYDPHIWFDLNLWEDAARYLTAQLSAADPAYQVQYQQRLDGYLSELEETKQYIQQRVKEVSAEQRVLVTAHDAFHYFGEAYGFEVLGLQGISTAAEAGTADMSALADFIAEHQIKAIFVESSVPPKTVEALQAAVHDRGFEVAIGGELYSDSLGDERSGKADYISTVRANVDTIVNALK